MFKKRSRSSNDKAIQTSTSKYTRVKEFILQALNSVKTVFFIN
jgi:hypothetical protein